MHFPVPFLLFAINSLQAAAYALTTPGKPGHQAVLTQPADGIWQPEQVRCLVDFQNYRGPPPGNHWWNADGKHDDCKAVYVELAESIKSGSYNPCINPSKRTTEVIKTKGSCSIAVEGLGDGTGDKYCLEIGSWIMEALAKIGPACAWTHTNGNRYDGGLLSFAVIPYDPYERNPIALAWFRVIMGYTNGGDDDDEYEGAADGKGNISLGEWTDL
ncbi:hypothetical protein BJ508DRAFT_326139 [Ascobolus immersus RN42]|uniref:Ecp2 effector protein domain-containing protein n=1 Tax=Ascobolus immersus RN42 TaxID=1160509 RepID=A0A3N4I6I1_ASCIM|nr:hypothetical protein BJ508DRAFT_326139 [Ascobolus immersus RN42]